MVIELKKDITQGQIAQSIVGGYIDQVHYYITGWDLRIISAENHECNLSSAEIKVPELENWCKSLDAPTFSLQDTNEPEDTSVAIAIFTVLNKHPIRSVLIEDSGSLAITFNNGCRAILPGIVEDVDWTWSLTDRQKGVTYTCDSGPIFRSTSNS